MKGVMKGFCLFLLMVFVCTFASIGNGQGVCPSCGKIHIQQGSNTTVINNGTMNVVTLLNRQRAKKGLYPLIQDPILQTVANRRAVLTGSIGRFFGHPAGSFSPARMEGVGMSSSTNPTAVMACGTYTTKYRYVGAAMVRRSGRSFFAVVYR